MAVLSQSGHEVESHFPSPWKLGVALGLAFSDEIRALWQKPGECPKSFSHSVFLLGMCQVTAAQQPGAQSDSDAMAQIPCQPVMLQ